jgi:type VI secretion system secreted protein Hcp
MAVDIFLKLDGIKGESTDSKHKGEIELESFSWGASNTGSVDAGGGGGAGKVSFKDFSFTAKVGIQSPQLFRALAEGEHIRNGIVTVNHGGQSESLVFMLTDILISGYSETMPPAAAAAVVPCDRDDQDQGKKNNNAPMESVSLNFTKIEFKI